jgi:hypothetical protein
MAAPADLDGGRLPQGHAASRFRLHVPPFAKPAAIFLLVASSLLLTCLSLLARIHPLLSLPPSVEAAVALYNTITHYPLGLFTQPGVTPTPPIALPRLAGMQYIFFDAVIFAVFVLSNALAVRRNPLAFGWVDRLRTYLIKSPATLPPDADPELRHLASPHYLFCLILALTIVFGIFSLKRAVAGTMDLVLALYIVTLLWTVYFRVFGFVGEGPFSVVFFPTALFIVIAIPFVLFMILDELGLDLLWWLIAGQESWKRFWIAVFPFLDLIAGMIVLTGAFCGAAILGELRFLVRLSLCIVLVFATLLHGALGS